MKPLLFILIVTFLLLIAESIVKIQANKPVSKQGQIARYQQKTPRVTMKTNKGLPSNSKLGYISRYSKYLPWYNYQSSPHKPNYFRPQSAPIRPQQYQHNQPVMAYPVGSGPNYYNQQQGGSHQNGGHRPQGNADVCSKQCSFVNGNQRCATCCRGIGYRSGGSCFKRFCTCRP